MIIRLLVYLLIFDMFINWIMYGHFFFRWYKGPARRFGSDQQVRITFVRCLLILTALTWSRLIIATTIALPVTLRIHQLKLGLVREHNCVASLRSGSPKGQLKPLLTR
jgi:hypothetical protein